MKQLFIFIFLVVLGFCGYAQEDENILLENEIQEVKAVPTESNDLKESEVGEFGADESEKKPKKKKEKAKKKIKGPYLVATNSKLKKSRSFSIGEKVSYLTKTDKKIQRGEIKEIEPEYIKIGKKRIKVNTLVMVKKKFFKTLGWRTVGLTQFGIGTGIAAVGTGVAIFSFQQIDPDSPLIIWGAFGTVVGTGIGLVGTHLMLKGAKGVFQTSKLKSEKGWKFSVKMK